MNNQQGKKIILATCGSRGDVQPMIAITLALQSAGHKVQLVGPPENAAWARGLGCPYLGAGGDVSAFINTIDQPVSFYSGLSFVRFVMQELAWQLKYLPQIIASADLAIGASLMFGLSSTAEAQGIPYRYIAFTPQVLPSKHHPFLPIQTQTLPPLVNRLSWTMADILDRCSLTLLINRYRKQQGIAPVSSAWDHILGHHVIVAGDREIAAVPPDVQKTVMQTGYPHLDLPELPHPDLERFLESGEKPVYAGFGSMPPKGQEKTIPLLVEAAKVAGRRIIIRDPGKTPGKTTADKAVFFIGNYSHRALFHRMAAVIHHGGAGTTAAAAAAGVPQVIVPHILDQHYHGRRIFLSGLGPAPIPLSQLTTERLSRALVHCLSSGRICQTARNTGRAIHPAHRLETLVKALSGSANT
ncbi:MAG: nucleotide disphospho-sugar-binding domain-containing protein [Desulfotignum sp.]|nr:nucleotide disphospho-sugar-binding domain-containing protein [Desulfotignum sp.]